MLDETLKSIISDNAKNMRRSAIRDLLKMATRPDVISFGGGFPDITAFPVDQLKEVVMEVLEEMPCRHCNMVKRWGLRN